MAGAVWAEDEIGRKWDRCFTDAILKLGNYRSRVVRDDKCILRLIDVTDRSLSSGGGIALGGVFSLFFFKSKIYYLADTCVCMRSVLLTLL